MQNHQGMFIVIEGSDGAGKTTQFELLRKKLLDTGYEVEVFKFPRHDQPSAYFVKRYLRGDYGPADSINPYTATLFYALDRYEAAPQLRKALADGKIVLLDRYVGSNMAHQGSKFKETIEKRSFFVWEDSIEFQLLGIPRPNINIFLRVPADVSYKLIGQRPKRSYTDKTHDEHEADINHLKKTVETFDLLCQLFPKDFKAINCAPNGQLLSIEQISKLVWDQLSASLPPLNKPVESAKEQTVLSSKVSDKEVDWQVENISLLAAYELKRMQPTFKAAPTWIGQKSGFRYFIPNNLDKKTKAKYVEDMNKTIELHRQLRLKLKDANKDNLAQIMRSATPLAALTSASVRLNSDSALELLLKIQNSNYKELEALAVGLQNLIKNTWPQAWESHSNHNENTGKPEAVSQIIEKLSVDLIPQTLSEHDEAVKLVDVKPRNEFDLLVDALYPYSDLSREEITAQLEKWNYKQKYEVLVAALTKPINEVLKLINYDFDFMTDRGVMSELLDLSLVANARAQITSPRYGYAVSDVVEVNGAENVYLEIFDLSLSLYSRLQTSSPSEVEYAALVGHRFRWQASISALSLTSINTSNSRLARDIVSKVIDSIKEAHPIVGEYLANRSLPKQRPSRQRRGRAPSRNRSHRSHRKKRTP